MDPTLRQAMRGMLEAVDDEHRGDPCSCGHQGDRTRAEHLIDVVHDLVVEPAELAPRVVHVNKKDALEDLDEVTVDTPADATDPRKKGSRVTGRRYVGPVDCPDCGRGLTSRGFDMICSRLSRDIELKGCHPYCIVACGLTDG